jgi:hypothetical protein
MVKIIMSRYAIVPVASGGTTKENNKISFPPEILPPHPLINEEIIDELRAMNSNDIRRYLREEVKVKKANSLGNPYVYRIYIMGGLIETLFPKTKAGERLVPHGRIDINPPPRQTPTPTPTPL